VERIILIGWIPFLLLSANHSQEWELASGAASWPPRSGHASVVHDGEMWVLGGFFGIAGPTYRNDVWHSADGIKWCSGTIQAPWSGRSGHSAVVYEERIWVLGGAASDGAKADVWYSEDGVSWVPATLDAPWSRRSGHTSVVHDGRIWVLGGGDSNAAKNDVWYSSDGVKWASATLEAPWSGRSGHTSVVHDGEIWVLGGAGVPSPSVPDYVVWNRDVWHSVDGITWVSATLDAPWSARSRHSSVAYGGRMWVLGGNRLGEGPYTGYNDVWHSSDGVNWTESEDNAGWSARGGHVSVVHAGKIWVLGGVDQTDWRNDVWYSSSLDDRSADLNNDGALDFLDLLMLLHEWKLNNRD